MNCIKKLPWSAGMYRADKKYYPQDRIFCDGSVFASLREQVGNKPKVFVEADGSYTVTEGWMLLAPGNAEGPSDYASLDNKPSINGVELVGDRSGAELGLVGSRTVAAVVTVTEAEYAALDEKDPATLYVITKDGEAGDET